MQSSPAKSFTPTTDLMNASPNTMFMFFLFHRWDVYLDAMMNPQNIDVDAATASLLSTCVDPERRTKFYDDYLEMKKKRGAVTASILISGDFFAYVAEACEFVEKSFGGMA
jgi:hypothetical protein